MKRWLVILSLGAGAACSITDQADTDAPLVAIISPKADSTVGGTVAFSVQALDSFGVDSVVFTVDGTRIGVDISSPFSIDWNSRAVSNGTHGLRAEATDPKGNRGFASISVTVDNTRQ